jgi:hypothetical protein
MLLTDIDVLDGVLVRSNTGGRRERARAWENPSALKIDITVFHLLTAGSVGGGTDGRAEHDGGDGWMDV